MNVTPIRPQSMAERHVQFSEFVEVRHIEPTETAPVQPSLYAQRLERELRGRGLVDVRIAQQQSKPVKVCKNMFHTIATICGALILPSFACLLLGPIGLIAPGALLGIALTCALLAGKPTEEMQVKCAVRAVEASEYDPR